MQALPWPAVAAKWPRASFHSAQLLRSPSGPGGKAVCSALGSRFPRWRAVVSRRIDGFTRFPGPTYGEDRTVGPPVCGRAPPVQWKPARRQNSAS